MLCSGLSRERDFEIMELITTDHPLSPEWEQAKRKKYGDSCYREMYDFFSSRFKISWLSSAYAIPKKAEHYLARLFIEHLTLSTADEDITMLLSAALPEMSHPLQLRGLEFTAEEALLLEGVFNHPLSIHIAPQCFDRAAHLCETLHEKDERYQLNRAMASNYPVFVELLQGMNLLDDTAYRTLRSAALQQKN